MDGQSWASRRLEFVDQHSVFVALGCVEVVGVVIVRIGEIICPSMRGSSGSALYKSWLMVSHDS